MRHRFESSASLEQYFAAVYFSPRGKLKVWPSFFSPPRRPTISQVAAAGLLCAVVLYSPLKRGWKVREGGGGGGGLSKRNFKFAAAPPHPNDRPSSFSLAATLNNSLPPFIPHLIPQFSAPTPPDLPYVHRFNCIFSSSWPRPLTSSASPPASSSRGPRAPPRAQSCPTTSGWSTWCEKRRVSLANDNLFCI